MLLQIFIHSLAIFALIVWASSYHFKERKIILLVQLLSFLFWIAHFILLGAYTGAILCSIGALRLFTFSLKRKNHWSSNYSLIYFFISILLISTIATFTTPWAIFAFLGGAISVIASWQDDQDKLRLFFIPTHVCWFIYDLAVGSYGGAFSEMILGISAIISLLRKI